MIPTVLIAGMLVGRLWAIPVLALTWVIPVALTSSTSPDVLAGAALLGAVNAAAGVGARVLTDRLFGSQLSRA